MMKYQNPGSLFSKESLRRPQKSCSLSLVSILPLPVFLALFSPIPMSPFPNSFFPPALLICLLSPTLLPDALTKLQFSLCPFFCGPDLSPFPRLLSPVSPSPALFPLPALADASIRHLSPFLPFQLLPRTPSTLPTPLLPYLSPFSLPLFI